MIKIDGIIEKIILNSRKQPQIVSNSLERSPKKDTVSFTSKPKSYTLEEKNQLLDKKLNSKEIKEKLAFHKLNDMERLKKIILARTESDKQFDRILQLLDKGVALPNNLVNLTYEDMVDDGQFKRLLSLLDTKLIPEGKDLNIIAELDEKSFNQAVELLQRKLKDIDVLHIAKMASLSEDDFAFIAKLYDRQVPSIVMQTLLNIPKENRDKLISALDEGFDLNKALIRASFGEKEFLREKELMEMGFPGSLPDVVDIVALEDESKYEQAKKLLKNGIPAQGVSNLCSLEDKQYNETMKTLNKICQDKANGKSISIYANTTDFQYSGEKEAQIKVTNISKDVQELLSGDEVQEFYFIDETGKIRTQKITTNGEKVLNYLENRFFETTYNKDVMQEQFETILDENGEIKEIIHRKASNLLDGVYDITSYNPKDCGENIDIVSQIKNGEIKGGRVLSKAFKDKNGVIKYFEDINGTKRVYSNNGITQSYSLKIGDFDLKRSFEIIDDKQTSTIINGKQYQTFLDDSKQIATIISDGGEKIKVSIGDLSAKDSQMWDFCKKLPADLLLEIQKYAKSLSFGEGQANGLGEIITSAKLETLAHELGHTKEHAQELKLNWDLVETYISEAKNYINRFGHQENMFNLVGENGKQTLNYFLFKGGGPNNTGLDELIAEANILWKTYGCQGGDIKARTQFLFQNFPQTLKSIFKNWIKMI